MFDHRQRTWTRQTWGWRLHVCLGCGPSAPRRDRRPSGRRGGTRLRHTGSVVDDFLIARNRSRTADCRTWCGSRSGTAGSCPRPRTCGRARASSAATAPTTDPHDPEIVEQIARSCTRRGATTDRGRENRPQIVLTRIRGDREAIFWQTARTGEPVGDPRLAREHGHPGRAAGADSRSAPSLTRGATSARPGWRRSGRRGPRQGR